MAARETKSSSAIRVLLIVGWIRTYDRSWLTPDAIAALSVWALLVPQGLAYATLAGVPVQYGLYTAFAALLAYAIFGTSRQVVQGPSGTVAAISSAVIAPLVGASALGTTKAVPYAAALAILSGLIYLVLGVLKAGWVSNFLSKAVLAGFILGFAIGIIIDQSYKLLGVPKTSGTYAQKLVETIKEIPQTNGATLVVGATGLITLLLMRRYLPRWPRALIVMAISIVAVGALDLAADGVAITGPVPTGLFTVGLPNVSWSDFAALFAGALSAVFVGYSESLASGREMAARHKYEIEPNQELIAQGAAQIGAGFVGGFVTDGSLSKTGVADTAGQRSQLASIINAVMILLTMLFLASLFEDLPSAILGAVVIDSMVGLIDVQKFKRYFRTNRADWACYMAAMLGMLFFGITQGILFGIVLSLLLLIARSSRPGLRTLAHDPRDDTYLDPSRHEGLEEVPGVLIIRIDGPLFFADATPFLEQVRGLVDAAAEAPKAVVLDAEAVSQTDSDGADILRQLHDELDGRGVALYVARPEATIVDVWSRSGAIDALGADHVLETTRQAVAAAKGGD